MEISELACIVEAIIFSSDEPVTLDRMLSVLSDGKNPERDQLKEALELLNEQYADHALELKRVASGYRFQVRADFTPYLKKMWEKKPPRMSRALLETLALVAYKQPLTRGEIEAVRGVAVSTNIMRTLLEREWVKIVGYKDMPGKPALFGTTKAFLDYFNIKSLTQLPELPDVADLEQLERQLGMELGDESLDEAQIELALASVPANDESLEKSDTQSADNTVES